MFRRKPEEENNYESNAENASGAPAQGVLPSAPAAVNSPVAAAPISAVQPAPIRPAEPIKPAVPAQSSFRPAAPSAARAHDVRASSANAADKGGKNSRRVLTVGPDITLKGEIASCDRLVIEGKVEANLNDVHTLEIAESGSFKGAAQIEDAEISGLFEGDLVVRGRLIIYATGKVRGKISYGEIEIERGGELTGEIKINGAAANRENKPKAA